MTTSPTRPAPPRIPLTGRSLRARWRFTMILGLNVLVLLVVGCAALIMALEQRQAIIRLHTTATRQARAALDTSTREVQGALLAAGDDRAALERLVAQLPALRTVTVVDSDGAPLTVVPAREPRDWGDALALEAVNVSGQPYEGVSDGDLILAVPRPDGPGAIIAEIDPQQLWSAILGAQVGAGGYLYLVDGDGALFTTAPGQTVDLDIYTPDFALVRDVRSGQAAMRLYKGLAGKWVVGRGDPVASGHFTIISETPLSGFVTPVVRLVALAALALILTALAGEWLIRRMLGSVLKPLAALQEGARAVSTGDYGYRVRIAPGADREFVQLGDVFNQMIDRLAVSQSQIDAYSTGVQEIVDQRARELSRKTSELERAAGISRRITSLLDPRDLTDAVTRLVRERFSVYHVGLLVVDEESSQVVPAPSHRPSATLPIALQEAPHSVIAWAARQGETVYVPDTTREPRYRPALELPASRCELALPLHFEDRVLGVLNLEADHRDAFARDVIEVLESLADEIAVALHNAQTFAALDTANRDLAQATLHASQASTLKSRFLNNAAHRLRGPLNTMIGYSETLLSGVYGALPEPVLERQRYVVEQGRALQALIEDMLDFSTMETGEMQLNLQWLPLTPLLEEVMNAARALHQAGFADHTLDLRLDLRHLTAPLPPLRADPDRLRYILITLLGHAVRTTLDGDVVLSAQAEDDAILITVHDTGPGLDENRLRTLFEPFQRKRGEAPPDEQETGLGLAVARLLATRHGGDLTVETTRGQGTTFTLSLPRHPHGAPPPPVEQV